MMPQRLPVHVCAHVRAHVRVPSRARALTCALARGWLTSQTQLTSGERGSSGFLPAKRESLQPSGTV